MKNTCAVAILALVVMSIGVAAQRGGRRGEGGGNAPTLEYDNREFGLKFPAPPGLSMFTPEHPGGFRNVLTERRIVYMADLMGDSGSVTVRYLPKATEAELTGFRNTMDANPPQAKLAEFKKIALGTIRIGAAKDKDAIEYVYEAKEKDTLNRTRQVVFLHNGNGFIFTCVAPAKDYPSVDARSFQKLFASIEFK